MAIVPIMIPAPSAPRQSTAIPEELSIKMEDVSITPAAAGRPVTGTSVRITVPLDATASVKSTRPLTGAVYADRKIMRRDSMDRREALLKGKEGSRQRRRWENGRYAHAPFSQLYNYDASEDPHFQPD